MMGLQKIKRRFSVAFHKKMSAPHLKSLEEEDATNTGFQTSQTTDSVGMGPLVNGLKHRCRCHDDDEDEEDDPAMHQDDDDRYHRGEGTVKWAEPDRDRDSGGRGTNGVGRSCQSCAPHPHRPPVDGLSNGAAPSPTPPSHANGHTYDKCPLPHSSSSRSIFSKSTFATPYDPKACKDLVRTLSDGGAANNAAPASDPTNKPAHSGGLSVEAGSAGKKITAPPHSRFRKSATALNGSLLLSNGPAPPHLPLPSSATVRSFTAQCRHHIRFFSYHNQRNNSSNTTTNCGSNGNSHTHHSNGGGRGGSCKCPKCRRNYGSHQLSSANDATPTATHFMGPTTPGDGNEACCVSTPSSTNGAGLKAMSQEEISKRLSLPADIHIPESFLTRNFSQPILNGPLSRKDRRDSLYEIGFGRSDTYTKLDKVGEGTYATVYRGRSRLTDNFVALKEIRLEYEEGAPCTAIREVSLLKNLKHANIVTLHDIVHTTKSLTLVFEYLERDLKQYMEDCDNIMNMNNVKLFLFQLFRGLEFCHRKQILHRDLKPQNLLINKLGELKLADFGLARAKSVPTKTFSNEVVTLWYRPPEVLLGSTEYSTPIDMWGVGCIFYEMANGKPLFPGSTVEDQLQIIFKTMGTPAENQWPGISLNEDFKTYRYPPKAPLSPLQVMSPRLDKDGINFLAKLLLYDPKKRISAKEGLRHPYFKCFPEKIHHLPDTTSIFVLPNIKLSKDPGSKTSSSTTGKFRRQSLL